MPPVADQVTRAWGDAIDALIDANVAARKQPDSVRSLAAKLAALPGSTQNAANWRTTVNRIRKGQDPKEPTAQALADAFSVPRSTLPPPAPPTTTKEVAAGLQRLSAEAVRMKDVDPLLAPLRAAIVLLANGDTQGALRVLSEAEGQ